jgi:NAD(P)-dependent dehydrogenase (short-subunit alcohol dehydrogenase family)
MGQRMVEKICYQRGFLEEKFQLKPYPMVCFSEDIANGVLWLASEESSFVTGHPLVIDGGVSLGFSWEKYLDNMQKLREIRRG